MTGWRSGFTFVELLVVISIILLLVSLLVAWAVTARKNSKVSSTQAAMSNLLLVTDTVKNASPIFPDHRLANYFYVQPHVAAVDTTPVWNNASYRRMSSGEFLAFLATLVPSSNTMIHSLGKDYLRPSAVPGSWGIPNNGTGILVDVFEQDPSDGLVTDKAKNTSPSSPTFNPAAATAFSLVSPVTGYALYEPVDAWGNSMAYRFYTNNVDLNQPDTLTATLYDSTGAANGTYPICENIIQDEQITRDRYAALGVAVDSLTASATTAEYVRPAVPSYTFPQWMSAGPDGIWGAFADGAPPARNAMAPDKNTARNPLAKDNIYSQETGR